MIALITVIILIAFSGIFYYWIIKRPHGFVEFKTGLILRFMPLPKGEIDLISLRNEFIKLTNKSGVLKISADRTSEISIPTRHGPIRARKYEMNQAKKSPLIVYFHGGGWCIGNLDTHHEVCTRMAVNTGFSLISIDYSLAPEFPFPQPVEECVDAVQWISQESDFDFGNTKELILMGDSAGGTLAIVVAQQIKIKGLLDRIAEVVPIYPVTDCFSTKSGSYEKYSFGYHLTSDLMTAFEKGYFKNKADRMSPLASPLLDNDLSDFPDTYLVTAGFDPLRDEGESFAAKLKDQGVKVVLKRYEGAVHSFFGRAVFGKKGILAVKELATYLKNKYN
jgi:acetyl esterase